MLFDRSQSASNAVQNARKKAAEMARLVEGSLGAPLTVEQLHSEECPVLNITGEQLTLTRSQFNAWQSACLSVQSTVRIMFELKPKRHE